MIYIKQNIFINLISLNTLLELIQFNLNPNLN